MKADNYIVIIEDETFDLPKDMPVPERGSVIFIGGRKGKVGVVDTVKYHISDGKIDMIIVYTTKQ